MNENKTQNYIGHKQKCCKICVIQMMIISKRKIYGLYYLTYIYIYKKRVQTKNKCHIVIYIYIIEFIMKNDNIATCSMKYDIWEMSFFWLIEE